MDDYLDARAFYMKRSWSRRTEFRRRQKKFVIEIKSKIEDYIDKSVSEDSQSGVKLSESESI